MRALAIGILLTFALAAGASSAAATPVSVPAPHVSKSCGLTTKGSRDYRVKARAVKCRFARRWVKRYLRSGRVASGYSCVKTDGGAAPFYCTKGDVKAYWAERL